MIKGGIVGGYYGNRDGFVVWWGAGQTEELPEGTLPEEFGSLYKRHQRLVNECTETHKVWRYCGNSDQYQRGIQCRFL